MNYLDSGNLMNRRPSSKLPDSKKERFFGRDISNVITDRIKPNQTLTNMDKTEKQDVRTKSKSFAVTEAVPARDVVY